MGEKKNGNSSPLSAAKDYSRCQGEKESEKERTRSWSVCGHLARFGHTCRNHSNFLTYLAQHVTPPYTWWTRVQLRLLSTFLTSLFVTTRHRYNLDGNFFLFSKKWLWDGYKENSIFYYSWSINLKIKFLIRLLLIEVFIIFHLTETQWNYKPFCTTHTHY